MLGGVFDQLGDRLGEVVGALLTVDAGQRGEEMVPLRGEAAAGRLVGHVDRLATVDQRVGGLAEAQLDPGAEDVADLRADVHPAVRRGDHVDAEAETTVGQLVDGGLEILELGAQRRPAVDHQEDVAERVLRVAALLLGAPVRRHALDVLLGEQVLPAAHQAVHLGNRAADPVHVTAGRDTADVRQIGETGERAATEVQPVELHLTGRVGEGEAGYQRTQEVGFSGL